MLAAYACASLHSSALCCACVNVACAQSRQSTPTQTPTYARKLIIVVADASTRISRVCLCWLTHNATPIRPSGTKMHHTQPTHKNDSHTCRQCCCACRRLRCCCAAQAQCCQYGYVSVGGHENAYVQQINHL